MCGGAARASGRAGAFANGEAIDSDLVCSLCSQARQCSRSHLSEYQSKLPVTTCIGIGLEQFPPTPRLAVTVNAKGCGQLVEAGREYSILFFFPGELAVVISESAGILFS